MIYAFLSENTEIRFWKAATNFFIFVISDYFNVYVCYFSCHVSLIVKHQNPRKLLSLMHRNSYRRLKRSRAQYLNRHNTLTTDLRIYVHMNFFYILLCRIRNTACIAHRSAEMQKTTTNVVVAMVTANQPMVIVFNHLINMWEASDFKFRCNVGHIFSFHFKLLLLIFKRYHLYYQGYYVSYLVVN